MGGKGLRHEREDLEPGGVAGEPTARRKTEHKDTAERVKPAKEPIKTSRF